MALMRVVMVIPETFEDLALKLIFDFFIAKGYLRVDLVANYYFKNFIKAVEKANRDSATKMIIKPPKSEVPRDFSNFFSNGENKLA